MSIQSFPKQEVLEEIQSLEKRDIKDFLLEKHEKKEPLPVKPIDRAKPIFLSEEFNLRKRKPLQWKLKRALDITLSLGGIACLSPLLTTVAILIKLDSKGPVIYKQKRVGLHGQTFEMYKFRSMRQDADQLLHTLLDQNETNGTMFKMFNDPRVTRIGRFIRKYSIDELPQLFNVLKGDMSLVGPRPSLSREVRQYKKWHHIRFSTLPGLTGIWQVSGRSKVLEFDTVVGMDCQYINHWNILLDLKLIFKTLPVVFKGMDTA